MPPLWHSEAKLRIGISSCLLGAEVRWDGGHKRDRFLVDELAPFVEWVPVCPELELGMGVPREPVQLVREQLPLWLNIPKAALVSATSGAASIRRLVPPSRRMCTTTSAASSRSSCR